MFSWWIDNVQTVFFILIYILSIFHTHFTILLLLLLSFIIVIIIIIIIIITANTLICRWNETIACVTDCLG